MCFRDAASTQKALEVTQKDNSSIGVKFAPKDKKDFRKVYNNIFIKNMPKNWTVEEVKNHFAPYGHITSVFLGKSEHGSYCFVCFGAADVRDREAGPRSAEKAVEEMDGRDFEGQKLYVREALKREARKNELMHETFKYKNSKKRCNLYVKGFPSTT